MKGAQSAPRRGAERARLTPNPYRTKQPPMSAQIPFMATAKSILLKTIKARTDAICSSEIVTDCQDAFPIGKFRRANWKKARLPASKIRPDFIDDRSIGCVVYEEDSVWVRCRLPAGINRSRSEKRYPRSVSRRLKRPSRFSYPCSAARRRSPSPVTSSQS